MKIKLCRPVLVESKVRTNFLAYKGRTLKYNQANFNDEEETIYYNLILISLDPNEKIEEGDKFMDSEGFLRICTEKKSNIGIIRWCDGSDVLASCRKVIATQSQLSPEYIKQFIEEYNKGEVKDIEVEMENYSNCGIQELDSIFVPKLTNGFTIIVEKEPINYTGEEVESILDKFQSDLEMTIIGGLNTKIWFEQNKKK